MTKSEVDIEMVWVGKNLLTTYKLPVYFTSDGAMLTWFNDYLMDFAKPKFRALETTWNTFEARAHDLKAFARYLAKHNLDWKDFNDEYFKEFIALELERVRAWQKAKKYEEDDPVGANINVNRKIHAVYEFYEWAQVEGLTTGIIGPGSPINTYLSSQEESKKKIANKKSASQIGRGKKKNWSVAYRPLCLPAPSSRKTIKHFATDRDINLLTEQLAGDTENYYIVERNLLFVAILNGMGLRAESAASLTASQIPTFEQLERETNTDRRYPIRPKRQKKGYQNTFEMSYSLCMEIRKFIEGPRADLLVSLGITKSSADDAIFLNSKNGKAMSSKTLKDIVREGFRKIGVTERRTGSHAIRRARANRVGEDIIRRKRRAGGLITPEIVSQELAKEMGHSSLASQEAYEHSINALEATTDAAVIAKLRDDLALRENRLALREAALAIRESRLREAANERRTEQNNEEDDLDSF